MTHKNPCGWAMPALSDGDVIEGGNLSGAVIPDVKITFIGVNLSDCILTANHTCIDCNTGKSSIIMQTEPTQDLQLASKAELVLQSLIASGKLSADMIVALNQLLGGVKATVNVSDIELGQAATLQTMEIIDSLKQQGSLELASQIEQALIAVQAIWSAE